MGKFSEIVFSDPTPEQEQGNIDLILTEMDVTKAFRFPLDRKVTLPLGEPDHSFDRFVDTEHQTSIYLEFPRDGASILLTFPPPESKTDKLLMRRRKPFQKPFASVTFPDSVSYRDVLSHFTGGPYLSAVSGVSVSQIGSREPSTRWDLKILQGTGAVEAATESIRATLSNSKRSETDERDHLVPLRWDKSGGPIQALLMAPAPPEYAPPSPRAPDWEHELTSGRY